MAFHFPNDAAVPAGLPSRRYAWLVFALTFGLMLSDYLSRQVIIAVFPMLKVDWSLTDTQLGLLVSIVALLVGVASFPIALLSDRIGRVKSAAAMAIVWGLATVGCGLSGNFMQLLFARALVGLGEAGYGSAGGAILVSVFPPRQRATVMGAFLAAALFGSVLGVALGGVVAARFGWRLAFILIGGAGLLLAVAYPLVVREPAARANGKRAVPLRAVIPELFAARTARWTYLGTGLQMFVQGSLIAWLPSFFNRAHGMTPATAALYAAAVVLAGDGHAREQYPRARTGPLPDRRPGRQRRSGTCPAADAAGRTRRLRGVPVCRAALRAGLPVSRADGTGMMRSTGALLRLSI